MWWRDNERAKQCVCVCVERGVVEDRAILLGFAMMAFSVLMFFVVGITVLKPYVARYAAARLLTLEVIDGTYM